MEEKRSILYQRGRIYNSLGKGEETGVPKYIDPAEKTRLFSLMGEGTLRTSWALPVRGQVQGAGRG